MEINLTPSLKRVAFIGNYLPRKCGIATFTTDLCDSFSEQFPKIQTVALAMNDQIEGYPYPSKVRYQLRQDDVFDYERAANFLNQYEVDVVCLQHEYGIFGGPAGSHILTLLRNVNAPVVTTLHTILEEPDPDQRKVLEEIIQLSSRLVVMSQRSGSQLQRIYGAPENKIDRIPHGIHDVPFVDPGFYKDKFGAEGRFVLLTFGLLSRNKGIEYVLEALPTIIKRYPKVLYVVLGATHPHVVQHEGDEYRERLKERTRQLGLEEHVLFHNEFVSLDDLKEFIGAADIYITPYLDREQIVSGTLAYTVGAGKAVISTPYRYAEELLDEGRGLLVPFRDSHAIAEKILHLMDNEAERNAIRKRAYLYGRDMIWPTVAQRYRESFYEARRQNVIEAYPIPVTGSFQEMESTLKPTLKLGHLERLTDDNGIFQHAVFSVPNYNEGYTTDDNARALIVAVQLERLDGTWMNPEERSSLVNVREMAYRYLGFLWHAFNPSTERFRNFMSYSRHWLEEVGSEDSHGRAIWALGSTLGRSRREGLQGMAARLFEASVPTTVNFVSPRAWAFALMGIQRYLRWYPGDRAVSQVESTLIQRLVQLYTDNHSEDWPWFENSATYCNAALPQVLLRYGYTNKNEEAISIGLESLDWLVRIQQSESGWLMPIGNRGFYRKGHQPAHFDQQPVEVHSILSACLEAYRATKNPVWYERATQAFDWFLGRNVLGMAVYDEVTGGCRDGLHIDRLNQNQGAESTLAFLQSLIEIRQFRVEYPNLSKSDHGNSRSRVSVTPDWTVSSSKSR